MAWAPMQVGWPVRHPGLHPEGPAHPWGPEVEPASGCVPGRARCSWQFGAGALSVPVMVTLDSQPEPCVRRAEPTLRWLCLCVCF